MTGAPDRAAIVAAINRLPDPCASAAGLDLSIIDIGLLYDVTVGADGIEVVITFTELGCQFTHRIVTDIVESVRALGWTGPLRVRPCWNPPWSPERRASRAVTALATARRTYPTGSIPLPLSVPPSP